MLGAGDGNRTHAASLEGWNSTIELHPLVVRSQNYRIIITQVTPFCQEQIEKKLCFFAKVIQLSYLSAFFNIATCQKGGMYDKIYINTIY